MTTRTAAIIALWVLALSNALASLWCILAGVYSFAAIDSAIGSVAAVTALGLASSPRRTWWTD